MEGVIEALNRARANSVGELKAKAGLSADALRTDPSRVELFRAANLSAHTPLAGNLKDKRIVAFDPKDRHTRIFDLLRNNLLAAAGVDESRVIAVTAPAHGCGVSTLAVNLAFSVARKRQWQVVVATLDRPQAFASLGLRTSIAAPGTVAGAATDKVEVGGSTLYLTSLADLSADGGQAFARQTLVANWIDRVKRECGATILILDLPPLPTSDESAFVATRADMALLVLGVGSSKVADLEACRSALARTPHYVVLNKARRHAL